MAYHKIKLLSLFAVVLILSASCSGFLVGRTVRLHEEGKLEQMQLVSDQLVDVGSIAYRCVDIVKRVILR